MSDQGGGPGWWLASDGKWYPPELATAASESASESSTDGEGGASHWLKRSVPLWSVIAAAAAGLFIGIASGSPSESVQTDEAASETSKRETSTTERSATTTRPTTTTTTTATTTTTTIPPTTAPPTTADPFAGETISQRNARGKAADYLDYSAFSRSGLIKQLEYEGFATADATYGVDALKADWFEQAAKKAADYMEYSSFSRSSLIEQLKYEGFTQAQAEHGADSVGF